MAQILHIISPNFAPTSQELPSFGSTKEFNQARCSYQRWRTHGKGGRNYGTFEQRYEWHNSISRLPGFVIKSSD